MADVEAAPSEAVEPPAQDDGEVIENSPDPDPESDPASGEKESTKSPSPKPDQENGEVAPPLISKGTCSNVPFVMHFRIGWNWNGIGMKLEWNGIG